MRAPQVYPRSVALSRTEMRTLLTMLNKPDGKMYGCSAEGAVPAATDGGAGQWANLGLWLFGNRSRVQRFRVHRNSEPVKGYPAYKQSLYPSI